MAVIKFFNDETGKVEKIPALKGDRGEKGPKGDPGDRGPKGDRGDDGGSFTIKGMYATYADLISAHPVGSAGDAYTVGTSTSNTIYNWNVDTNSWDNIGAIQGPKGEDGMSASITIGSVESGAVASVENVGTAQDAIFNFVLPKGDKGDDGKGDKVTVSNLLTTGDEIAKITVNNTEYSVKASASSTNVVDALDSTSATDALSANQGRVLATTKADGIDTELVGITQTRIRLKSGEDVIGSVLIDLNDPTLSGTIAENYSLTKEYKKGDYCYRRFISGALGLFKCINGCVGIDPLYDTTNDYWEDTRITDNLGSGGGDGTVRYNAETDRLEVLYNNEWVPSIKANAQWDGKIYSYGNEATSVTGGWSADGYAIDSNVVSVGTKNSDSLYMVGKGGSNTRNIFGTATPIDLQKYTKMVLTYKTVGSGGKNIFICNSKTITPSSNYLINVDDSSSVTTKVIDISNFAYDSAYIAFCVSNANTRGLYVYEAQFIV